MSDGQPIGSSTSDESVALEALAGLIRDAGAPVASPQVDEWADQLGLELARIGRVLTRRFREISYIRIDETYVWRERDAAAAVGESATSRDIQTSVMKQIVAWVAAAPDERAVMADDLRDRLDGLDQSHPALHVARAVGVDSGEVDWHLIEVDEKIDARVVELLEKRAPRWWLLQVATAPPAKRRDDVRKRLLELPSVDRNELAAEAIVRWVLDDSPPSDLAGSLRRLKPIVGDEMTQRFLRAAIDAAQAMMSRPSSDDQEESDRILAALAVTVARSELLEAELSRMSGPDAARHWILAMARASRSLSDRAALIASVAGSEHRAALFDRAVFDGLDIDVLGRTLSLATVEPLLERGLGDHVSPAVRSAMPTKIGLALAAFAEYPVLEQLAPTDYLGNLIERDEASARVLRAISERLVTAAVDAERDVANEMVSRLREEQEEARRRVIELEAALHDQTKRSERAEERWRSAIGDSTSASAAELRQAQLDVLRSFAEVIEGIRSVQAHDSTGLIGPQLSAATRAIESFGVILDGRPGEMVPFDPARHQDVGVDPGTMVAVVTPTYRVKDSDTPLRYGLVGRNLEQT